MDTSGEETSAQPRSSTWSCCMIQQCPLLSWLSNKWLASESAGVLVHDSIRFHRPTFVLLVGSCRFNFSRAVDLALWLLYASQKKHTHTHTRALILAAMAKSSSSRAVLGSFPNQPSRIPIVLLFLYLSPPASLWRQDPHHRSNTSLFLLWTNALSCKIAFTAFNRQKLM